MLLPHGYEGQGPEHSSARLERYLQLCASYNLRVCNTTTPANYFHVLRRQVMKKDRRPLVLMTPKVLLRLRGCVSSRQDFAADKVFIKVIVGSDKLQLPKDKVKRLIFVVVNYSMNYWTIEKNSIKDVELVRSGATISISLQNYYENNPVLSRFGKVVSGFKKNARIWELGVMWNQDFES